MIAQFLFLLQNVAPIFAVMAVGYAARELNALTGEADRSLTRVVVTFLAPCLAFDTIIGNEALIEPENWILPPLFGFLSVAAGVLCAQAGALLFGISHETERRTFVFANSLQNYSYIPLLLCAALFSWKTMGVLFAFCLGVELAFWTIALWQLTGQKNLRQWWKLLNAPMIAIPSAIILNLLGAEYWIPPFADKTLHMLGICAIPMALLLSGALLADSLDLDSLRRGGRTIAASAVVRVGVMPLIILLPAWLLPLNFELKAVLVLEAAMPAAIFPIIVTKAHEGDMRTALQVVIGTSLIGLVTIPLWIGFGMRFVLGEH